MKETFSCKNCSKLATGKVYPKGLCQACYNYFRKGGTVHELPKDGTIEYDERGYVICHICGMAYIRLGSHIKESHAMTIAEYKKMFGLCNCCKTTEEKYSQTMRESAYKNNMPERLQKMGMKTRFKIGDRLRLGKPTRLQENIDKRTRMNLYYQNKGV